MIRRGRCRCGTILQFRKGTLGYKTRCPTCQSVVRLRVNDAAPADPAPAPGAARRADPPPVPSAAPGLGLPFVEMERVPTPPGGD